MSAFPIILAEVADKEPPVWFFYAAILICAVAALPMLKSKWTTVVALPLALLLSLFSAAFMVGEIRDPHVGPAIVQELGHGYVASAYAAAIFPLLLVVAIVARRKKNA